MKKVKGKKKNKKCILKNEIIKKIKLPKIYLGYTTRLIIYGVLFLGLFTISVLSFVASLTIKGREVVEYKEKGDTNYRVYLKPNDFYEQPYLENKTVYIASLINNIQVDFDYLFEIDKSSDLDFSYDVVGTLKIKDNAKNVLFEKDYVLLTNTVVNEKNKTSYAINEQLNINYDYYNTLSQDFQKAYGVDSTSSLDLKLKINKRIINEEKNIKVSNSNSMLVSIPLTEKTINIAIDNTNINNTNNLYLDESISVNNVFLMVLSFLTFVVFIVSLYSFVHLLFKGIIKKSKYDKTLEKYLREYDRLIVETPTKPQLNDKEIIKITSMNELLDARDNLKRPIMYYSVIKHQKAYFYILNEDTYYLYVLKAIDLEG